MLLVAIYRLLPYLSERLPFFFILILFLGDSFQKLIPVRVKQVSLLIVQILLRICLVNVKLLHFIFFRELIWFRS